MYLNDKQGLWHAWLSVTLMALSQWPGALRSRAKGLWLQVALPLMLGCALLVAASAASAATETVTYIHTDVSGSPLAATDSNGAVVWKESYRAYGERWLQQSGTGQQSQWFHGKEQDPNTGLQYFGARYYDPAVGRFLGVDPVDFQEGNPHSFNRFAYGNNNPVKYKDPDGGYAEAAFEALSLAIGIDSFRKNFGAGNYGAAAVDGLGVAADAVLAAVPVAPGVAGLGIKAIRESSFAAAKGDVAFFRGAKAGEAPSFVPRPSDFKVDAKSGFVKDTHGVSVFDNPLSVNSKGYVAHLVDKSSIPDSLRVIQRGNDPRHFEIVPMPGANLTPQQFINACSSIVCAR